MRRRHGTGWKAGVSQGGFGLEDATGGGDSCGRQQEYAYEIIPTNFKEDRWVQMAEVLSALRSRVHHAVVYVRPRDSNWLRHASVGVPFPASTLTDPEDRRGAHGTDSDVLLVYAPGSSPNARSEKMAKFRLRPCFSDALPRQSPRRFRSIKRRTDFLETHARAARADAATRERPLV